MATNDLLIVKPVKGKGRGVFATKDINPGTKLEICPVIVVKNVNLGSKQTNPFWEYAFSWGNKEKDWAIALGYGSLYNHSYDPNASAHRNPKTNTLEIYARTKIKRGSEITINYSGPGSKDLVWFDVK